MEKRGLPPFFHEIFTQTLPRKARAPRPGGILVADLGRGCGAQTIRLAGKTDGTIMAPDDHRPFLDELRRR